MKKELISEITEEFVSNSGYTLLEGLINCFLGNPIDFAKNVKDLMKQTKSIPDMLFWNNFVLFLQGGNFDYDILRKLSSKLEESGTQHDYAAKIIYCINKIDDPQKVKFFSDLTISMINDELSFEIFFKLIKVLENMVYSDLLYLSEHIEQVKVKADDELLDEFLSNGLIYMADDGFSYTSKAYSLVKYSLRRGHEIRTPEVMLGRHFIPGIDEDELKQALNRVFNTD